MENIDYVLDKCPLKALPEGTSEDECARWEGMRENDQTT